MIKNDLKEKLYKIYEAKGIEKQIVNIFGVRKTGSSSLDNRYEDVLGFDINGEIYIFEGTTKAGKPYTLNPLNIDGCACVKEGFHKEVWQIGFHRPDTAFGHEAFVQTGNKITVVRDKNKNGIIDPYEIEYVGFFGINLHGGGKAEIDDINRDSAGCQVMRHRTELLNIVLPEIKKLDEIKKNPKFKFSYLLLNQTEFPEVFVF